MRSKILARLFHHHLFVVGPVAQIHFRRKIAFEDDQVATDSVDDQPTPASNSHDRGLPPVRLYRIFAV
jgi:hypothetical protein